MDPRSGALDALHHHHSLISDHTQQPHSQQPHLLPHPPSNHSALYRLPAHHYPRPQPISTTHPYSFPPSGPPSVPQLSAYLRGQQPLNPRQLAARSSISHPGYHPHHPLAAHRLSTTCIPSLIPPGMDPGQVDMRTFFPYQPNEVKHRKRTTRSQLKVLEDVYKYDTKPNASLRKKLAEELGMTPRGVQVWFQNRRAKTKSQARKADAVKKQNGGATVDDDKSAVPSSPTDASSPIMEGPESAIDSDITASSPSVSVRGSSSSLDTLSLPSEADETQSISSGSNTITDSPTLHSAETITQETGSLVGITASNPGSAVVEVTAASESDDSSSLWTHPNPFGVTHQSSSPPKSSAHEGSSPNSLPSTPESPSLLSVPDIHLLNQRRTSLPIIFSASSSPPSYAGGTSQQTYHQYPQLHHRSSAGPNGVRAGAAPYNIMNRRRSVDTNIMRLGHHPLANLAQQINANIYGGVPPHVNPTPSSNGNHLGLGLDGGRMRYGSMPHVFGDTHNPAGVPQHQQQQGYYRRPMIPSRVSMPTIGNQQQTQQQDYSPPLSSYGPQVQVSPPPPQPPTITSSGSTYEFPSVSTNIAVSAPGNTSQPPSPSTLSPLSNISSSHIQQHHSQGIVYSSRSVEEPIPGPLPEANFSFGDPNASSTGTTSVHSTPPAVQGQESEDDGTTSVGTGSSYDMRGSRFGSLASIASIGSESSYTSAYYSNEENGTSGCEGPIGQGFHPDIRRASVASGHLSEMFNDLDVNGTNAQMTSHIDVRRASSSSSGGSAPISPVHDGSSPSSNHLQGNDLCRRDSYSSPGSTISASSHKAVAVMQMNEMTVMSYGYHQPQAENVSIGMQGETSSSLVYSSAEYPESSDPNANGSAGNTSDVNITFTNPFGTNTTYDASSGYSQNYTGMDDGSASMVTQTDQGGAGPIYGTGAIELSHMCVPANMGVMGNFGMVGPYMTYP